MDVNKIKPTKKQTTTQIKPPNLYFLKYTLLQSTPGFPDWGAGLKEAVEKQRNGEFPVHLPY